MLKLLRQLIPERSPLRLAYHKYSAVFSALWFRFPAKKMRIIAVTGTSGKSTTCELIWYLLSQNGEKAGMISGIQFHFPNGETSLNETLRTTLRAWTMQKLLRKMYHQGATYVVIEISSHAIDQQRIWGIPIDIAVLTNTAHGEHLDYHDNFAEYVQTKAKMFRDAKIAVLNQDDPQYEVFAKTGSTQIMTFSRKNSQATLSASRERLSPTGISFDMTLEKEHISLRVPLIGEHNLENILSAVTVAHASHIPLSACQKALGGFPGLPGRLEIIPEAREFQVLVDHTYKPPALQAVLQTLKKITSGRLIVVWGGTGNRLSSFWEDAGEILHEFADEIVLTTDDPYKDDPKKIASFARKKIPRHEGEGFFEIEDRYEAIRYALLTAEKGDIVLIAGRGCEQTQTIGKKVIPFDDREVAREILAMKNEE